MNLKRILIFCLSLFLLSSLNFAQREVGTFLGTITDEDGVPLPGVTITGRNTLTEMVQATVSNEYGRYRLARLPRGNYNLTASLEGFKTLTQENFEMSGGSEFRVDFVLEIGALEEEITVIGVTPMVETTRSQVSTVMTEKELLSYPQQNRNFLYLMQYAPGTQPEADIFGDSYSVRGSRGEMNNYMLDGMDNNDMTDNAASSITTLPPESIQEFRLITNNFSVEYGRNIGGMLNVVMKSGTNELHGSSWFFYRGDSAAFRSEDWLSHEREDYNRTQFGATLGGPIAKDKTFFFLTAEKVSEEINNVVPWFVFTDSSIARAQGTARQMFDKYGSAYPKPTYDFMDEDGDGINDYGRTNYSYQNTFKALSLGIKLDHIFSEKDRLAFRWLYNNVERTNANSYYWLPGRPQENPQNNSTIGLTWLHLFGPTAYNEMRIGARIDNWYQLSVDKEVAYFDWFDSPTKGMGDPGYPMIQNNKTYQIVDVLNFQKGNHSFKMGGEFRYWHNNTNFDAYVAGYYLYLDAMSWIDNKSAYMVIFGADPPDPPENNPYIMGEDSKNRDLWKTGYGLTDRKWAGYEIALFAQDDWRANDRLTVSMGLRWDFYSVPKETTQGNHQPAFGTKQGYDNTVAGNLDITEGVMGEEGIEYIIFDGRALMGKGTWNPYYYNFAPKVSFAYDLTGDGKTSLRGGVGVAYERQMNRGYENDRFNYPAFAFMTFYGSPAGGSPIIANMNAQLPDTSNARASARWMLPDDMKPQMAWNWLLGIQRELAPNLSIEVDYSGTEGRRIGHIDRRNRYTGDGLDGSFDGLNPYMAIRDMNTRENRKYSRYHGVSVILNKRFSSGWSWYSAYTLSQAKNHADMFQGGMSMSTERDDMEYGFAGYDHRHRMVGGFVFDMPFFKESENWLFKNVLGGWQLAGSYSYTTGAHYTISTNSPAMDWNYDGHRGERPIWSGSKTDDPIEWTAGRPTLDTTLFKAPNPPKYEGQPGSRWTSYDTSYYDQAFLTRNQFTWFPGWNIDLSLQKYFTIPIAGRDVSLQLIGEVFNLMKSQFWQLPNTSFHSGVFGSVGRKDGDRRAQFSIRVMF